MVALSSDTPLISCEGTDDEAFIRWLLEREHTQGVQVAALSGKDGLRTRVRVLLSSIPGRIVPPAVAIILDADDDPAARRMSIQNVLINQAPDARHGLYVVPGGDDTGMLEGLCLAAGRHRPLIQCATEFADCASRFYTDSINRSKVRYDAYCSVVRPTQMGVRKGFNDVEIDVEHPGVARLITFLRHFSEPRE